MKNSQEKLEDLQDDLIYDCFYTKKSKEEMQGKVLYGDICSRKITTKIKAGKFWINVRILWV